MTTDRTPGEPFETKCATCGAPFLFQFPSRAEGLDVERLAVAIVNLDERVPAWRSWPASAVGPALRAALTREEPDAPARRCTPHRPRPNAARTHCLDCGRPIRKGERRPSGLYWRHVKTESNDAPAPARPDPVDG